MFWRKGRPGFAWIRRDVVCAVHHLLPPSLPFFSLSLPPSTSCALRPYRYLWHPDEPVDTAQGGTNKQTAEMNRHHHLFSLSYIVALASDVGTVAVLLANAFVT